MSDATALAYKAGGLGAALKCPLLANSRHSEPFGQCPDCTRKATLKLARRRSVADPARTQPCTYLIIQLLYLVAQLLVALPPSVQTTL